MTLIPSNEFQHIFTQCFSFQEYTPNGTINLRVIVSANFCHAYAYFLSSFPIRMVAQTADEIPSTYMVANLRLCLGLSYCCNMNTLHGSIVWSFEEFLSWTNGMFLTHKAQQKRGRVSLGNNVGIQQRMRGGPRLS